MSLTKFIVRIFIYDSHFLNFIKRTYSKLFFYKRGFKKINDVNSLCKIESMSSKIELNEVTKKLPKHLHQFIVNQHYDEYTAQNQAVWRYVMRMNISYLSKVAHPSYLEGLKKNGNFGKQYP